MTAFLVAFAAVTATSYSAGFRNISDGIAAERQECVGVANMPPTDPTFSVITEQLTPALGEAT